MSKALFTFKNTRSVLIAERACKNAGLACRIIPVPRTISLDCTMALECEEESVRSLVALFKEFTIDAHLVK